MFWKDLQMFLRIWHNSRDLLVDSHYHFDHRIFYISELYRLRQWYRPIWTSLIDMTWEVVKKTLVTIRTLCCEHQSLVRIVGPGNKSMETVLEFPTCNNYL